jgi:triacylglycerol esterase/lipase EstA (alpha/beta hydrolase family)
MRRPRFGPLSARRMLRLLLLAQAAAALAIGACAWRWFGVSAPAAVLLGAGLVVLVRLLINANNFFLSSRSASATPAEFRINAGAGLRLFGEEFAASMLQSSWSMPRAAPRQVIYPDSTRPPVPPVLLLHGYGCNSGYWSALTPLLDAARISHATLDLEPVTGDIDGYVPAVQQAAEALCAAAGAPQVIVVAHSMGGLVARAWLRAHGAARVARVITLGTPHHGTSLAGFGVGRNAAQMRRLRPQPPADDCLANPWLDELAAAESLETRALITSIYSHHDNIVSPQTSSFLEGARNLDFGGVGHVALGRNRRVLERVMQEVRAAAGRPA